MHQTPKSLFVRLYAPCWLAVFVVLCSACDSVSTDEMTDRGRHAATQIPTLVSRLVDGSINITAPVDAGLEVDLTHGYNDPLPDEDCGIGATYDHCNNQLYGLDLDPSATWDGTILAPMGGTVNWIVGDCLGILLDNGLNLTICHFSTFVVEESQSVCRGLPLGTSSKNHVHLNVDDRRTPGLKQPVPFSDDIKFEGESLVPSDISERDQRFDVFPIDSTTYRVAVCK